MAEKKKIRAVFRKNRAVRARSPDLTRHLDLEHLDEAFPSQERVSGKGELTRKRTVRGTPAAESDPLGLGIQLEVDENRCRRGRVLSIHGRGSLVQGEDGVVYRCAVRRLLKTLATTQRNVLAVGDRVLLRSVEHSDPPSGFIERIEPRYGCISRGVRGRQQVVVANCDQVAVVASATEPPLKPNLIDRMLVAAEKGGVCPLVCINKVDLVDPMTLIPLVGVYAQLGYRVLLLSAKTGFGLERLRRALQGRQTVFAGQSGVGKSSLLNRLDPNLRLPVRPVSKDTHKGCHATTTARLLVLPAGGFVVDTPGMRQFELWDVIPAEVPNFFREFRPYLTLCRFPDCTHTHETDCAVKNAVADGRIDTRRYESYSHMIAEPQKGADSPP
jgi:ribosome biogenesis GTPase